MMPFDKTGWVTDIDWKTSAKGGKYLTATVKEEDGTVRQQNVFGDLANVFAEAHEQKLLLNWVVDKKPEEKYWNVTKASLAGDALKQPSKEEVQKQIDKGTDELKRRQEPAPQDRATSSKNGSFALAYAKDLATGGVIDKSDILEWADRFLQWLDTGSCKT